MSWTKGNEIVLEKNPTYVRFGRPAENPGPAYLDKLIVRQIPEAQARLAALQTGEVQLIVNPPWMTWIPSVTTQTWPCTLPKTPARTSSSSSPSPAPPSTISGPARRWPTG
ncbi:MAG: ABC transporter substrate-binding protein [Nodosilinea sp. LVE1205-7]